MTVTCCVTNLKNISCCMSCFKELFSLFYLYRYSIFSFEKQRWTGKGHSLRSIVLQTNRCKGWHIWMCVRVDELLCFDFKLMNQFDVISIQTKNSLSYVTRDLSYPIILLSTCFYLTFLASTPKKELFIIFIKLFFARYEEKGSR